VHDYREFQLGELLPNNAILTAAEVAKAFRVSVEAVRRWAEEWSDSGGTAGLPGFKIGKQWRFSRKAVSEYLARRHGPR
jgi:excisionase family DNA binding protein